MAAYGGIASIGAGAAVTSLRTGNLNVTGSDPALICGVAEVEIASPAFTIVWDPDGNNESMTGNFANVSQGTYMDMRLDYLDDPTAANAPIEVTWTGATDEVALFGVFFTAAGNIVATDTDNDSFATTGTSLTATVPNTTTNDLIIDFVAVSYQTVTLTPGDDQTARVNPLDGGGYLRCGVSTQAGDADSSSGEMSWTFGDPGFGGILIAARVPDVGGGGGGLSIPVAMHHHRQMGNN